MPRDRHSIEFSEEAGVRFLHFGSDWIQGAMRLRKPEALELEYTRDMLACLLWRDWSRWPRAVLVIGLGAGSLVKFLHHRFPKMHLHVVEIDPRMPAFARAHFGAPPDDDRLTTEIADGARFVADSKRTFDLILVDGFDHRAKAGALDTPAFYRNCRARLAPDGIMATNLFGTRRGFEGSLQRVADAFEGNLFALPPSHMGNVIAFGYRSPEPDLALADLKARARLLDNETGLNQRPLLKRMVACGMLR